MAVIDYAKRALWACAIWLPLLLFASIGLYLFFYYFSTSTLVAKALCAGGLLGLFLMTWAVQRVFFVPRDAYGKAAFAASSDLRRAELLKRGPIIGKSRWRFIRHAKPGHLLTFAPTRSGKGVGAVIPNLLDHPGSVVVTDIKGENHAVTRAYRETLGRVIAFAPFDSTLGGDGYNPIDFIRTFTPKEVDDARMIAEMLVAPDGKEANHWEREARTLLTGLLLHVALERKPQC
ncbi:type IV secretory system conjugative DNA transfer family protein [Thalassobaculum sp. OXR-137]|uniref:type IV secretory system conjugative DNA transfer family protein n=1 Tax=Thalassobaculum sp. OXR-137 TaxID=3100173 RepID=UPI002AC89F57|nr:type IV secretory system conjugative DNA transfer family protein [Thalassobaculum sp. OXR-137]WPZ34061.1 type IV secretory system conjugative DNA transfer family protein [Thalassobaculum sp. OXR-137]